MSDTKRVYLHYNPGEYGDIRLVRSTSKEYYNKYCKYGTLCIKDDNLVGLHIDVNAFLTSGKDYIYLDVGYSKLAYEDRKIYSKRKGRELSKINCLLRKVKINGLFVTSKTSRLDLELFENGLKFTIEYNHATKKNFIEKETW